MSKIKLVKENTIRELTNLTTHGIRPILLTDYFALKIFWMFFFLASTGL